MKKYVENLVFADREELASVFAGSFVCGKIYLFIMDRLSIPA